MTESKYAVKATHEELIAAFIRWRNDPNNGTDEDWAGAPDLEWAEACIEALRGHLDNTAA